MEVFCSEISCTDSKIELPEKLSEPETDLISCSTTSSSEHKRRVVNKRSCLDAGLWSMLDDDMVEKIIARLPFKSLFQAMSISKAWSHKFLSLSFQSEVLFAASIWKPYSPLFANDKMELIGFEKGSQRWQTLPTHSYLPKCTSQGEGWCLRAAAGPVLCWSAVEKMRLSFYDDANNDVSNCYFHPYHVAVSNSARIKRFKIPHHICLSNPLTRSWKQLPRRPFMNFPEGVHVDWQGTNAYQVAVVSTNRLKSGRHDAHLFKLYVQIFDSRSTSWTLATYNLLESRQEHRRWIGTNIPKCSGIVYINGVIYFMVLFRCLRCGKPGSSVISYDTKNKIWNDKDLVLNEDEKHHHRNQTRCQHWNLNSVKNFHVVTVCDWNLMLVVYHEAACELGDVLDTLFVFRLDLESGLAFEVSKAPTGMLIEADYSNAVGQGDCIYIGGQFVSHRSLLYNTRTLKWGWIPASYQLRGFQDSRFTPQPCTSSTYQPGLNPFFEV